MYTEIEELKRKLREKVTRLEESQSTAEKYSAAAATADQLPAVLRVRSIELSETLDALENIRHELGPLRGGWRRMAEVIRRQQVAALSSDAALKEAWIRALKAERSARKFSIKLTKRLECELRAVPKPEPLVQSIIQMAKAIVELVLNLTVLTSQKLDLELYNTYSTHFTAWDDEVEFQTPMEEEVRSKMIDWVEPLNSAELKPDPQSNVYTAQVDQMVGRLDKYTELCDCALAPESGLDPAELVKMSNPIGAGSKISKVKYCAWELNANKINIVSPGKTLL
eukprot:248028_1